MSMRAGYRSEGWMPRRPCFPDLTGERGTEAAETELVRSLRRMLLGGHEGGYDQSGGGAARRSRTSEASPVESHNLRSRDLATGSTTPADSDSSGAVYRVPERASGRAGVVGGVRSGDLASALADSGPGTQDLLRRRPRGAPGQQCASSRSDRSRRCRVAAAVARGDRTLSRRVRMPCGCRRGAER